MARPTDRLADLGQSVLGRALVEEVVAAPVARAQAEARAVLDATLREPADVELAAHVFAAAALAHLAADGVLDPSLAGALTAETDPGGHGIELTLAALDHPVLAALAFPRALRAHAEILLSIGAVSAMSTWRVDPAGRLVEAGEHGAAMQPRAAEAIARRALAASGSGTAQLMTATPILAFDQPGAAIVWQAGDNSAAHALVARAAAALTAPLQLALTADKNMEGYRAVVQGPERRLTRLALDLHDGALQDVALIAGEMRRLEDELRPVVAGTRAADPVRQVLETIASLIDALETDLREVATPLEGPGMLRRPFGDAIESIVRLFRARTPIATAIDISGDLESITDSQRIAIFRIVQEALNNVRQHSRASAVSITLKAKAGGLEAEIADDGVGFDPARALDDAANAGRLGLLGMVERVRMLGGRCDIRSRPSGGTTIRVTLSSYQALPDRRTRVPLE